MIPRMTTARGRNVTALAIHLPQFHPIPENDAWWGKGFTEWTKVAGATPLFDGHDQPRIPTDLGFYDLRLAETRQAQADLARASGFDGFCYYHYWFHGTRLLDRPISDILQSGRPDFPFCLFWANETWSRRWLGEEKDVLISQTYSFEDNLEHARYLAAVFADPRYVRVGGRPLFVMYRPHHLGGWLADFIERLRSESLRAGAGDPMILGCSAWAEGADLRVMGLDGTLDFQPKLGLLPGAFVDGDDPGRLERNRALGVDSSVLRLYGDADWRRRMTEFRAGLAHAVYPSVVVSWDNTPRRGQDGIVILPRSPEAFRQGLQDALDYLEVRGDELAEPVVFVNAWNEWAEGNYLEPDRSAGSAFLDVCRDLLL